MTARGPLFQLLFLLFLGLWFLPLLPLYFFSGPTETLDPELFDEARWNTILLAIGTVSISTVVGVSFALCNRFYSYPLKNLFHILLLMPLAFPAYVLAFVYLATFSEWSFLSSQGELWFLIGVLSLSLTPYVYYFSNLGLGLVSQSELETEKILQGGRGRFFRYNLWPKLVPFLVSSQILVLFESLSDFGAASVINVPVITTMIYKLWFDLFSFSGAVSLAAKYTTLIMVILVLEALFKPKEKGKQSSNRDPLRGEKLPMIPAVAIISMFTFYIFLAFLWPGLKLFIWSFSPQVWSLWTETLRNTLMTLALGGTAGLIVVMLSLTLHVVLKFNGQSAKHWQSLSTVGYCIPGSVLAVGVYALLLKVTPEVNQQILLVGLVLALSYKFFTVAMRSIGDTVQCLPKELIETTSLMQVRWLKVIRDFIFPYIKESSLIAFVLVMIEVMKEMPLTLMLSPSGFQTLSINIFNYTSEGEWEKAALPSLMLLAVGVVSVGLLTRQESSK